MRCESRHPPAAAVASAGVLPVWKPAPVGADDEQLPVDAVRMEGPLHAQLTPVGVGRGTRTGFRTAVL